LLVRTRQQGVEIRLTVQDSRAGLAPGGGERLVESFYTTKENKIGFGLSISRSVIQAHHALLWASTDIGPSTRFAFSILCEHTN
jgi:C4-dicarboxylate-specific signal transduction histidine kinase